MRQDMEMGSEEEKAVATMWLVEHGAPELLSSQRAEVAEVKKAAREGRGVSVAWRKALSKSHAQWKGLGLDPGSLVSAREAGSDEQQQEQQQESEDLM